ncbi:MAG: hypothetical protein IPP94_03325 [Ignavibacteria bacterium]|nr:hypothetical protein [Ignavibacteria bacterium]
MAKTLKKTQHRAKPATGDALSTFDLDVLVDKYAWLIVPVLVLLYYWFSTGSTGFYQDDEIGHYRNIRQFWGDPFSIMGNQPKPGWKILMVLPGLLGFTGVVFAHCLVAALTVFATYKLGRALKVRNSSVAALLLAAQPLYLQLSFRSYSEITAGLFMVLMVLFYYQERYILAALTSSYIFSIRQEFALISIGLGVIFLMKKQWLPFLLLAWTPVALALIGWASTGNAMWLFDDMRRIGLNVQVPHKPFWHYFETYIFMVGPVTLALFMAGYWAFLVPWKKAGEQLRRHGFLFFTFTMMWAWSVISAWDLPNFGANPGHWRYLLTIAPLTAIYAGMGLNAMFDVTRRKYVLAVLGVFALLTLAFLSKESNGLTLGEKAEYGKLAMVAGVGVLFVLFAYARALSGTLLVSLLLIGTVGYTLYAEKPRVLDSEGSTMKEVAAWYRAQTPELQARPLYANHVLLKYFADIDINDKNRDRSMQKSTLAKAPAGSIVIWDSHYGNSQFGGDVPMEYFKDNPDYTLLQQLISPDQRFGALIFEKVR